MASTPEIFLVEERTVVTWQPNGWPAGVITGSFEHIGKNKIFIIEHVVTFVKGTLGKMIKDCTIYAKKIGVTHFRCEIPHDFAWFRELDIVVKRNGFKKIGSDDISTRYVKTL